MYFWNSVRDGCGFPLVLDFILPTSYPGKTDILAFYLLQNNVNSNDSGKEAPLKTFLRKEKMLISSNFSFSVFFLSQKREIEPFQPD